MATQKTIRVVLDSAKTGNVSKHAAQIAVRAAMQSKAAAKPATKSTTARKK